jgi:hypothetical protein
MVCARTSKVLGPLGVVVGAIDTLWGIIKDANRFGKHPSAGQFAWDFLKRESPFGFLLPKNAPSWPQSHGSSGPTTVNVILPKDSDAGHARRIANLVIRGVGAVRTDGGYIVPGSYNSVPSLAH